MLYDGDVAELDFVFILSLFGSIVRVSQRERWLITFLTKMFAWIGKVRIIILSRE